MRCQFCIRATVCGAFKTLPALLNTRYWLGALPKIVAAPYLLASYCQSSKKEARKDPFNHQNMLWPTKSIRPEIATITLDYIHPISYNSRTGVHLIFVWNALIWYSLLASISILLHECQRYLWSIMFRQWLDEYNDCLTFFFYFFFWN